VSRKKSKQRQAVPEEILAEGSGPVGEAAEVHADEPAEPVKPAKKARKAKGRKQAAEPEGAKDEGADELTASAEDELESLDASSAEMEAGELSAGEPIAGADAASDLDVEAGELTTSSEDAAESLEASGEIETDVLSASAADELGAADATASDELIATADSDEAILADDTPIGSEASAEGDDVVGEPITDEASVEAALLPGSLSPVQLRHLIEALIFATDKPVTLQRLRQLTRISDVTRIEQALAELHEDYKDRGIALHQVSGGYQFRTNTAFSSWVQQLIQGRPVRLSRAQLETLAIVAYRQPITRPEIDEIRGVDSSNTLRLLLDRSLIRVLGRREEVGRPTLYGTTKEFLDFFSLSDLRELPTLREYSELTAESRQVMSDRLGVPLDADGELEADEPLGDADLADEGPRDEASIVDSILAEHAAAEAEAEARIDARHDVGADLAEAAMSGGSAAAFRDIFDEPDPDAMLMSGEMSPTGSEARSYVDAIRAGALAETDAETDHSESHLAVSEAVAAAALEADHVSDDLATASIDAAAESDAVEVASEELLAASEDLAAVVADEVEAAEQPHVGLTQDGASAEDVELRADEAADQPHAELTPDAASAADDVELRADEATDQPDVGLTHVGASVEDVELRADEATDPSHVELTPDLASAVEDVELRADEAADQPHVGLTQAGAVAEEVELRSDDATDQPHAELTPDAASAADDVELRADEAADQPHVGLTHDDERTGEGSVDETADSDDPDSAN